MTEKMVLLVAVDVIVKRIWLRQSCRQTPSYFASSAFAGDTAGDEEAEDDTADDGEAEASELPEPPPPHATSIVELSKTARYFI
ncbi:MAG TPA: hypothetical protein DCP03_03765 [Polaromonas sp.]|nr:hypothetical protein [Polaromonas sp.]